MFIYHPPIDVHIVGRCKRIERNSDKWGGSKKGTGSEGLSIYWCSCCYMSRKWRFVKKYSKFLRKLWYDLLLTALTSKLDKKPSQATSHNLRLLGWEHHALGKKKVIRILQGHLKLEHTISLNSEELLSSIEIPFFLSSMKSCNGWEFAVMPN